MGRFGAPGLWAGDQQVQSLQLSIRPLGGLVSRPDASPRGPQCWLWVAGPDYYLDDDGAERRDLEPDVGFIPDGWWTCAPQTRAGNLVLLYRSQQLRNIAHLLVTRSDAALLDLPDSPFHGRPVCQYEVVTKFRRPIPFSTINSDDVMRDWGQVRLRFVRSGVAVPETYWQRLFDLAGENRTGLEQQAIDGLRRYQYERDIQDWLFRYPAVLAQHGLRNLTDPRREVLLARGSRADLLFCQRVGTRRQTVVIELKRGPVGPAAVEQVLRYRKHLEAMRPRPTSVLAVLVGSELDSAARSLARRHGVRFIALEDLKMIRAADALRLR